VPYEAKHSGNVTPVVTSVSPLTEGVSSLALYYTAAVDPGKGQAVATEDGGDVVIAYETVGRGDAVVICDGSFFGYVLNSADNSTFVPNLATLR
jgi:hypothetical protein